MIIADARAEARTRLPEVLAGIIPGFRPERAFRCLNPDHDDRHPSARYLSRANMVKCFSCGWSGGTFDVVGAVYGLDKSAAFKKTYELLGIDARGGGGRPRKPVTKPKANPGSWADIAALIYPPGWDATEEIKLPEPLELTNRTEEGLTGRLALNPELVTECVRIGLRNWHFDDPERGAFYDGVRNGVPLGDYAPESLEYLRARATPEHLFRRMALFILREGQRRKLETAFAMAYSSFQNQEPPDMVLEDVLNQAELAVDCRFDMPARDDSAMDEMVADIFRRFHDGDDVLSIVSRFRRGDPNREGTH